MRMLVAGGSGFLGRPLCDHLVSLGHDVAVLTRSPRAGRQSGPVRDVAWAPGRGEDTGWRTAMDGADAVINLAGAGIADRRWTAARKRLLRSSRIEPTQALADAVRHATSPPAVFIQGSAVGYYGATLEDRTFDESSSAADDFLGTLCQEWEDTARPVEVAGSRLVFVRTGIALARDGGALREMERPFRFFVGGPIASGRQAFSWIHRDDWIALVGWALATEAVRGPINATAPAPVTNAELSRALGRALRRPSWAPVPGFVLRLLFGELADEALIKGQRVVPHRALELGFEFRYPAIDDALAAIYRNGR